MTATKRVKAKITKVKVEPQAQPAPVPDGNRWHMLYTPIWRAQLDYGVEVGLIPARETIIAKIGEAVEQSWEWRQHHSMKEHPAVSLTWEQVSDTQWQASGNDGLGETTLVIATLTRVG